ncbi:MAG: 1,4-dihydroxy-2-naphthoate octaprenyltransferase [Smithellaceae bacterium]|nr:1,4-dihydroxy-2-naphthoate octaprenyltransferase [Smithellaceae bacterium]
MRIRSENLTDKKAGRVEAKLLPVWIVWMRALRLHFVGPSILPALLGGIIAWAHGCPIHLFHLMLVVAGVAVNHFGLNLTDDVLDYRHAVDLQKGEEKNFFTGGSGVLTEGLLKDSQMLKVAALFFAMTVVIGVYLTYTCGWPVLALGLFGMASSIFYTAPPIRFGYRGFGEAGLLVNFGPVIVLGSYYVQAQAFAWEPLIASLVPGLMMWSMIIINEIPDYETDRRGGKWNLVARFGRKTGAALYAGGLVVAYGVLAVTGLLKILSPFVLLGLVSLPLAVQSFVIMRRHLNDPLAMAPANQAMIKIHSLTCAAMIAAYLIEGIRL